MRQEARSMRRYRRRTIINTLMLGLTFAATVVALVPLVLIIAYVIRLRADGRR